MSTHSVLLINPPRINGLSWTREGRCQEKEDILGTTKPPLSLAILASILRNNSINFRLIDATALNLSSDEICTILLNSKFYPNSIVYPTTTATIVSDTRALCILKKRFNAKLVAFGAQISGNCKETLEKIPEIDIGIIAEPEYTVLDLVQDDNESDLNSVSGIAWRNGEKIIVTHKREWIEDLNQLPQPAWDLFPLEQYVLPFINKKYLLVETSRGCPFACDFCVAPLIHGLKFREKQPEVVLAEIEDLKAKYEIEYFYLFGDTVTLNKKFIDKFCDEVIQRNLKIHWLTNTRADTLYDVELVRKMKASGCWMLSIGIESYNAETRADMHKRLETDKIREAIRLLRSVGILSFGFFIYGYPGETKKDMYETTQFALSLPLDYANFYPAVPYPGTALYSKCQDANYLRSTSWDEMEYSSYIIKTRELNEANVKKAISNAYIRFYLRPQFILRHLKNIGLVNFLCGCINYGTKFFGQIFTILTKQYKY